MFNTSGRIKERRIASARTCGDCEYDTSGVGG